MEIRNIYDSLRGGRLFSTLLTESELRLFANLLDEGLTDEQKRRNRLQRHESRGTESSTLSANITRKGTEEGLARYHRNRGLIAKGMRSGEYAGEGGAADLRDDLHTSSRSALHNGNDRAIEAKAREQQQSRKKQKAYEQQSQIRARKEKADEIRFERKMKKFRKDILTLQQGGAQDPVITLDDYAWNRPDPDTRRDRVHRARTKVRETRDRGILDLEARQSLTPQERKEAMIARLSHKNRTKFLVSQMKRKDAAKKAAQQVQSATPQPNTSDPSVMTGVGKETQAANNAAKQATTQTAKTTAQNTATNIAKNNSIFNRRNAYIAGGLVGAGILGGYLYNRSKKSNRDRE